MSYLWEDCPFRDRVSVAIDIYKAYHIGTDQEMVMFLKPGGLRYGTGRQITVLYETVGDNPSDEILNKIQGYLLDGVPFND